MRHCYIYLLSLFFAIQLNSQVEINYVGNMGVYIEFEKTDILIDGLHKQYRIQYQYPPAELVSELINNGSRDNRILLISHIHRDHFDIDYTLGFLSNNNAALCLAPDQINIELQKSIGEFNIADRTRLKPINQFPFETTFNNVRIKCYDVNHANQTRFSQIENIAYQINSNNLTILHLGDANVDMELFDKLSLRKEKIDILILPIWFLLDPIGRKIIDEKIQAKQIIACHISALDSDSTIKDAQAFYPDATYFTKIGQTTKYTK